VPSEYDGLAGDYTTNEHGRIQTSYQGRQATDRNNDQIGILY